VIDRLLKLRDKVPTEGDNNSVLYAALNQLNPERWRSNTLTYF
jgi:hypothetical protein